MNERRKEKIDKDRKIEKEEKKEINKKVSKSVSKKDRKKERPLRAPGEEQVGIVAFQGRRGDLFDLLKVVNAILGELIALIRFQTMT